MDIEQKIKNLYTDQPDSLDADQFLTKLHRTRETRLRNKQRFAYGITSFVVILLIGFMSVTNLNTRSTDMNYNYYLSSGDISDEMVDEFYDDLMIYLADQSDDVWSTMELYYEVSNEQSKGE